MRWHAPAVEHLFEQRLQQARLELMEDNRIRLALRQQGSESTSFLRHLTEEKFAAAARSGIGAVEASLRSDATNFLTGQGRELKDVRKTLANLGLSLLDAGKPLPHKLHQDPPHPRLLALLFFVAWTATFSLGWLLGNTHDGLYALFLTGGTLATLLIYWMLHRNNLHHRAEIARQYPIYLCRQYVQALKAGIERYEDEVARIASLNVNAGVAPGDQ